MDSKTQSSLDSLFQPQSVAVIGTSNIPGKWGFVVPLNIRMGGYKGKTFLVNPTEKRIQGFRAYPRVTDITEPVDLAIITIPAPGVPGAMKECARKGIHAVVVISSNFSEVGKEGARLEREVVAIARESGIAMVGPNTMGFCSPPAGLFALYSPVYPEPGTLAFVTQSGNLGVQVLGWAYREGVGISRFVNSGNEAALASEQFLDYFGGDQRTRVILMYIEGVKDGQRFLEVARRVSRSKPIIALKAGATEAGARAARSHSGSIAGERRVFEAAAVQAGIVLVQSSEELIETAKAFSSLPVPRGNRAGVMTMGGGWGVVAADACAREGLLLPPLPQKTTEYISSFLPAFWSHGNPVDMVGTPQRTSHFRVLDAMARTEDFDSIVALGTLMTMSSTTWGAIKISLIRLRRLIRGFSFSIFPFFLSLARGIARSLRDQPRALLERASSPASPAGPGSPGGPTGPTGPTGKTGGLNLRELSLWDDRVYARKVMDLMNETGKPILTAAFNPEATTYVFKRTGLVAFGSPERAAMALARLVRYGAYRNKAAEREREALQPPSLSESVRRLLNGGTGRPPQPLQHGALDEHEGKLLLRECGIPIVREETASSLDEALSLAGRIGYPVCLKVLSPQILHKTEAGGVALNIESSDTLRRAYDTILSSARTRVPGAVIKGVLVQEMVGGSAGGGFGTEVIVGMSQDPQFGPVVLFGLGGIFVEALRDVSLRVAPVSRQEAWEMVNEIKGAPVLKGFRGQPPADVDSIVDVLVRLSSFAFTYRERIAEIDINPLIVHERGKGAKAVDALVVLR